MAKEKPQWHPLIVNILADGTQVPDMSQYTIPATNPFYRILRQKEIEHD